MGILEVFKRYLTTQFYQGTQAHLVPRGVSLPIDVFGSGEIRNGKKIEFTLPLYASDNRYVLQEAGIYDLDRVVVDRSPAWIQVGGYIYIGKRELHEVYDVTDSTIILSSRLLADHPANQEVFHYSNPAKVEGNYSIGHDVINIDTASFIVRGDFLAIPSIATEDSAQAFKEYRIIDYTLVSIIDDVYQYQVYLDQGIHRDLDDEEIIQLRAFMAYKSKVLNLPVTDSVVRRMYGPFLIDWLSAPFITNTEVQETQTVQYYNAARQPVGSPRQINKNHLVLNQPIKADQFLFWDRVSGQLNYDAALGRLLALLDDKGQWWLKHTCAPNIEVPYTYASGHIITTDKAGIVNNNWFKIDDSDIAVLFEYKIDNTYVQTPSAAPSGSITVTAVAGLLNNDWVALNDGYGNVVYFELMVNPSTFTATP